MAGTIDAPALDAAMQQLLTMGLRGVTIKPISTTARRAKVLRGDDFLSFNDQLAHLAKAGMPVEHGLRLLAQDLKRGRLAATVRAVADELQKGVPLEQAIEKYQDKFPPLYARLVAAGSRNGDLAATLFSTGQ